MLPTAVKYLKGPLQLSVRAFREIAAWRESSFPDKARENDSAYGVIFRFFTSKAHGFFTVSFSPMHIFSRNNALILQVKYYFFRSFSRNKEQNYTVSTKYPFV